MAENIQDAESAIRDTDVAAEMMSYVKNNILVETDLPVVHTAIQPAARHQAMKAVVAGRTQIPVNLNNVVSFRHNSAPFS